MKFSNFLREHNRLHIPIDAGTQAWLSDQNIDITKCTMTPDGLNVNEPHVYIKRAVNGKLPVKFNQVYGNFAVSMCDLTTLEGCPVQCYDFDCSNNPNLKSLEGGPTKVEGDYHCSHTGISTLEGLPKIIKGSLVVEHCNKLTSLLGSPKKLDGIMLVMNNKSLKSLKYGPVEVGTSYNVSGCDLRSLEGAPDIITGSFGVGGNPKLSSLEGGPSRVVMNYVIDNTPSLKSLHNIHKHIKMCGEFHCNGYKTHMLGVTMISSKLVRTLVGEDIAECGYTHDEVNTIYKILKANMGNGMDGAINAQSELLDHLFDEVAQL